MSAVETITLLGQRLDLTILKDGFKPGLDSVMLAAACPAGEGDSVLDMGCAAGAAGLCVLKRVAGTILMGVDIQAEDVELARKNALHNDMTERAEFVCADIHDYEPDKLYDHVICNPPFMEAGTYISSPSGRKETAIGQASKAMHLEDWVMSGFHALESDGTITIIHRADMVDKIIQALGRRFGAIEIIPLQSKVDQDAKRVIVRAIKNRKTPARLHRPIIVHEADGEYTAFAQGILRDMKAIA